MTESDFQRLRPLFRDAERSAHWRTIPWRIDLASAILEANERGMPLFLCVMSGNPAGQT